MKEDVRNLASVRCFYHELREAAAICPSCGRFFCRECVTEHDDRVICASCLKGLLNPDAGKRSYLARLVVAGQSLLGFLVLWIFFYYLGQALLSLPSSFHEDTVWEKALRNLHE